MGHWHRFCREDRSNRRRLARTEVAFARWRVAALDLASDPVWAYLQPKVPKANRHCFGKIWAMPPQEAGQSGIFDTPGSLNLIIAASLPRYGRDAYEKFIQPFRNGNRKTEALAFAWMVKLNLRCMKEISG